MRRAVPGLRPWPQWRVLADGPRLVPWPLPSLIFSYHVFLSLSSSLEERLLLVTASTLFFTVSFDPEVFLLFVSLTFLLSGWSGHAMSRERQVPGLELQQPRALPLRGQLPAVPTQLCDGPPALHCAFVPGRVVLTVT